MAERESDQRTLYVLATSREQVGNQLHILLSNCQSINFTSFFNTSFSGLNWSGSILIFIVPSAPHENTWFAGPVSICITPVPMFRKMDCRECSLIKVWRRVKVDRLQIWKILETKLKTEVDDYFKNPNEKFKPVFLCKQGISKTSMGKKNPV